MEGVVVLFLSLAAGIGKKLFRREDVMLKNKWLQVGARKKI
jgi:hypothetical protein